jgi:hypothetical protein
VRVSVRLCVCTHTFVVIFDCARWGLFIGVETVVGCCIL